MAILDVLTKIAILKNYTDFCFKDSRFLIDLEGKQFPHLNKNTLTVAILMYRKNNCPPQLSMFADSRSLRDSQSLNRFYGVCFLF